jgi:hypothetical protein
MEQGELTRSYDTSIGGSHKGDVFPIFKREAVLNEEKSKLAHRPIFDSIEMIQIVIPGDGKSSPVHLIRPEDIERFPEAYQRFRNQETQVYDGTPVDAWPRLTTVQAMQLKAMNFHTIESIAACSDANLGKLGLGGLTLRDMAKAWIEAAASGGNSERLVATVKQLENDKADMARTIADMKEKLEALAVATGTDVTTINVDAAMSHARSVVVGQKDLPEGWQQFTTRQLLELCGETSFGFPIAPRNKAEALSLLNEYQGTRDALKK